MIEIDSPFASSRGVWKYISELGISKGKLSMENIETILNSYDGKVEMSLIAVKEGSFSSVDGHVNRTVSLVLHHSLDLGILWTLPNFYDSCECDQLSSSNCIYMTEWL